MKKIVVLILVLTIFRQVATAQQQSFLVCDIKAAINNEENW